MADLKAGENMTGKFNNSNNGICLAYSIITPIVVIIGGAVVVVKAELPGALLGVGYLTIMILFVISLLPVFLLKKCEFSADDEKIVFRAAFLEHTYRFSEIKSASTQAGFSHSRYGTSARVELVITLSDGECITFYDEDVPDEALSTPKNHKKFQDTHQFTALCKYINERASG
ncbi:MAG: hypothetical protein K2N38_00250 [Oscillospiraceae bacterium]|nr:hypothetical protein [Oscillospiraceae bacterium]